MRRLSIIREVESPKCWLRSTLAIDDGAILKTSDGLRGPRRPVAFGKRERGERERVMVRDSGPETSTVSFVVRPGRCHLSSPEWTGILVGMLLPS